MHDDSCCFRTKPNRARAYIHQQTNTHRKTRRKEALCNVHCCTALIGWLMKMFFRHAPAVFAPHLFFFRGVLISQGNISLKEQAELASKTLGAFGVGGVVVAGGACEELFVPRKPLPSPPPASVSVGGTKTATDAASPASTTSGLAAPVDGARKGGEGEGVGVASQAGAERRGRREGETANPAAAPEGVDGSAVSGAGAEKSSRSRAETRASAPRSSVPSQLCVFKVDDFVYPGMRRRYNIFEPRYRALVKRCLRDGELLLLLPLSLEGNAVGTAAYISGLFNVHEDGR